MEGGFQGALRAREELVSLSMNLGRKILIRPTAIWKGGGQLSYTKRLFDGRFTLVAFGTSSVVRGDQVSAA
jgi:hypothetical protein